MSWRGGSQLFIDIWPLVHSSVPDGEFRKLFMKDLIGLFISYDMDAADLRRIHPEIDSVLDDLGIDEG